MTQRFHPLTCCYLQYPAIRCTKVAQCVVPNSSDEDSGEQDICHLPVEKVDSVVRLWHQSGLGGASVITFRALGKIQYKAINTSQRAQGFHYRLFFICVNSTLPLDTRGTTGMLLREMKEQTGGILNRLIKEEVPPVILTNCESNKVIKRQWLHPHKLTVSQSRLSSLKLDYPYVTVKAGRCVSQSYH